ncbi:MAG: DUF6659 family protein [Nitrososphaeraceae archaeon]
MDYNKLCKSIFALHDDVRYAGVVDESGVLVAGGMRKGIDSIVDETSEELYLAQTSIRRSMRERFDDTMGKARFSYVEREKLSILTLYLDKKIVLITLEPNIDSHTVIDIAEDSLDMINGKIDN